MERLVCLKIFAGYKKCDIYCFMVIISLKAVIRWVLHSTGIERAGMVANLYMRSVHSQTHYLTITILWRAEFCCIKTRVRSDQMAYSL